MIPTWRELKNISRRQRMDGKVDEAISTLNASLELAMADAPEEVAKICNILADLYVKGGNIESAERMARKSLQYEEAWGRELSGNEHLATYNGMMLIVLEKAGRFPEAHDYMREAVEQFTVIRGAQDDYVALMKERLQSLKT